MHGHVGADHPLLGRCRGCAGHRAHACPAPALRRRRRRSSRAGGHPSRPRTGAGGHPGGARGHRHRCGGRRRPRSGARSRDRHPAPATRCARRGRQQRIRPRGDEDRERPCPTVHPRAPAPGGRLRRRDLRRRPGPHRDRRAHAPGHAGPPRRSHPRAGPGLGGGGRAHARCRLPGPGAGDGRRRSAQAATTASTTKPGSSSRPRSASTPEQRWPLAWRPSRARPRPCSSASSPGRTEPGGGWSPTSSPPSPTTVSIGTGSWWGHQRLARLPLARTRLPVADPSPAGPPDSMSRP